MKSLARELIRTWAARKPRKRRAKTAGYAQTEELEGRVLLSADVSLVNGVLSVEGTNANDRIDVQYLNGNPNYVVATVKDANGAILASSGAIHVSFINKVEINAMAGGDQVFNTTAIQDVIYGGDGYDHIEAGGGKSTVYGGNHNDVIYGNGGDDLLIGDSGNDFMVGGNGNDVMNGGNGHDTMYGGAGNDFMVGGWGADYLNGGSGDDSLLGDYFKIFGPTPSPPPFSNNADVLLGGSGKDALYGQYGNDYLDGGKDGVKDALYGGQGADDFNQHYNWWYGEDDVKDFSSSQGDDIV